MLLFVFTCCSERKGSYHESYRKIYIEFKGEKLTDKRSSRRKLFAQIHADSNRKGELEQKEMSDVDIPPPGCDPSIWCELPESIRLELKQEIRPPPSISSRDPSTSGKSVLGKRTLKHSSSSKSKTMRGEESQRKTSGGVVSIIRGTDSVLPDADAQRWHTLLVQCSADTKSSAVFEDSEFPATSFSICGKDEEKTGTTTPPARPCYVVGQVPECFCHALAALRTVQRNTPNRGRQYYCCLSRRCKYFQWLDGDEHIPSQSSKRKACTW